MQSCARAFAFLLSLGVVHGLWSTCPTGSYCVFYCHEKLQRVLYAPGPHMHLNPFCSMHGERRIQDDVIAGEGRPPIEAQSKLKEKVWWDWVAVTNMVPKIHLLKLQENFAEKPYLRDAQGGKNLDYRLIYMETVQFIKVTPMRHSRHYYTLPAPAY